MSLNADVCQTFMSSARVLMATPCIHLCLPRSGSIISSLEVPKMRQLSHSPKAFVWSPVTQTTKPLPMSLRSHATWMPISAIASLRTTSISTATVPTVWELSCSSRLVGMARTYTSRMDPTWRIPVKMSDQVDALGPILLGFRISSWSILGMCPMLDLAYLWKDDWLGQTVTP